MIIRRKKKITGPAAVLGLVVIIMLAGCIADFSGSADISLFRYHARENLKSLELFTTRLYAKNPKYEPDPVWQQKKVKKIFHSKDKLGKYMHRPSNEVLTAAFAKELDEPDRVYLLGLGLSKSIREVYGLEQDGPIFMGLQISLNHLQRLHHNLSQVNWQLKTYKDEQGELLFKTNEAGENGYINMGYEVIMTEILTRVQDDIYLRGGLPARYIFSMSTIFVPILL